MVQWHFRRQNPNLEHEWRSGRGEVERLSQVVLGIVLVHVTVDHDRFGGTLFSDQQHGLLLLGYQVNEKLRTDVVYHGNQDGAVLGCGVGWIVVIRYLGGPVDPASCYIDRIIFSLVYCCHGNRTQVWSPVDSGNLVPWWTSAPSFLLY